MRRSRPDRPVGLALFALAAGGLLGCYQVEHDVRVPQVQEFEVAPKEARYDNAPTQGFTKQAPKKEFKPGLGTSAGGSGGGMGGMGGPGGPGQ